MISDAELVLQTRAVLWATFLLSAAFGAIVRGTGFCTMGAVSDVVNMGSWTRMRQWALAVAVAMLGFAALVATGRVDAAGSVYADTRWMWLSTLVGGGLFGVGMVLASGCGSKILVRIGAGNLKALVAFLVMALSSYITLRGLTAVLRDRTVDRVYLELGGPANLGHWLAGLTGWSPQASLLAVAAVLGGGLLLWVLLERGFANATNLLAGLGLGAVIVGMWATSGWLGFVAEHPHTLEPAYLASRTGRMEALSFTAPLAYSIDWLMFFSDSNQRLNIATVSVLGVVCGAAVQALLAREFRWEGFRTTEDLANHLGGAALMGVGGVTALGCTIGQGMSGLSNLSLSSFTAVTGILAGAVLGIKYQNWRLERQL